MTIPPGPLPVTPLISAKRVITLALFGVALSGPVRAEGTSTAQPPAREPRPVPRLVTNPADIMAAMAHELDKNPDQGVFVLQTITITQAEMADVIRAMPVTMASLGYAEVSRRAVDTLVSQKAMVLNALKDGLDKDPFVIRRTSALRDRALADAWLTRKGDAAINDQALRARYDHDIAGKPGPTEVRARLILVPTEDEASAVIDKAANGDDFGDLARKYSKDGSASNGGDLGYVSLDAVAPEIGAAMFALAPGQITLFPMKSPAGYFILRVEGRRQRGTPSFDEARPQLEAMLRSEAAKDAIVDVMTHIKMVPVAKPGEPAKK